MANKQLKIAIIQSGRRAYEIERDLSFWPSKLSKIISGIIKPTNEDRVALAKALGKTALELFPPEPIEVD